MQITDILAQMGGVSSIANQLGIDEKQAQRGAEALLPALLGGFKKQAQAQPDSLAGIGGLLGQLGASDFLSGALGQLTGNTDKGNDILGQVFGSKDVSRTVVDNAAQTTGLNASQLKKMLPILATMIASFLAKQEVSKSASSGAGSAGGGLGGLLGGLGGLLGGAQQSSTAGQSGLSSLVSMLDLNKDGNPLDDIMRMMGK